MTAATSLLSAVARCTAGALALAVAAGIGCGARTSLDPSSTGGAGGGGEAMSGSGGSGGGGEADGCPRAEAPAWLHLDGHTMSWMGNVASDGCSFAATWIELRDGRSTIVATTFRVLDGAWVAAPVVALGPVGGSNNSPEIAWNGAAYVVAWADEVLHLQRLDVDGALLGEPVTAFTAPGNVYVRWLQPAEDASLRVGFTGFGPPAGYDVHVARVGPDGAVIAPPTALTATADADIAGFLAAPGGGTAFWTTRVPDGVALLRARFEDGAGLIDDPVTMLTGVNVLVSRHGVATADGEVYVGVRRVDPDEVVLARVGPEGHVLVEGVAGGDVPVLAATGRGALGVLAGAGGYELETSLELTVVEGGSVITTDTVHGGPTFYDYAMAGSDDTLGLLVSEPGGVSFTTFTP